MSSSQSLMLKRFGEEGTGYAVVSRVDERLGHYPQACWDRRYVWAVTVGCLAGCAQVVGLNGYGPLQDATEIDVEAGVDTEVDRTDEPDGAVTEAAAPADGSSGHASGEASIGKPVVRDAAADTSKGGDGNASGDAAMKQPVDASTDATDAHPAFDGAVDAPIDTRANTSGSCPAQCSGGCALGTCVINVGGAGNVNCPADLPCEVQCHGDKACGGVINCAAGQPCQVVCNGTSACTNWPLSGVTAMSLCVDCSAGGDNGPTCRIACLGPACKPSCN